MYLPKLYAELDLSRLHDLIDTYAFGTLVVAGEPPEIAHLPFVLDRDEGPHGRLRAHVALGNPLAKWPGPG